MTKKELIELRQMIQGSMIRVCQLSLTLHKEQERYENIISIIDSYILLEKE